MNTVETPSAFAALKRAVAMLRQHSRLEATYRKEKKRKEVNAIEKNNTPSARMISMMSKFESCQSSK
jgi:hypothetical protein